MKKNINRTIKIFMRAVLNYISTLNFINIDWSNKIVIIKVILASVIAGFCALIKITPDEVVDSQTKDNEEQ